MTPLLGYLLLLAAPAQTGGLTLHHDGHYLEIRGDSIPGGPVRINYLEAYCRAGGGPWTHRGVTGAGRCGG